MQKQQYSLKRLRRAGKWALQLFSITVFLFVICAPAARALTLTNGGIQAVTARVGDLPSTDTGGFSSGARFTGLAYPQAKVTVLKGLIEATSVLADGQGRFSVTVPEESWQFFALFATDTQGLRSTILNFPTILYTGFLTDISGIRFAPTITTDKIAIRSGDFLSIGGSSLPNVPVRLSFENETLGFTVTADGTGRYNETAPIMLKQGEYLLRSGYVGDKRTSKAIRVVIGSSNILRLESTENIPGDCNVDDKITLTDFSVLAYWYGKPNPPACVDTNKDGRITLVDFSILAFYWSG